jgi:hypothetical protein
MATGLELEMEPEDAEYFKILLAEEAKLKGAMR